MTAEVIINEAFESIENTSLVDRVEWNLVQPLFYRNGRLVDRSSS